MKLSNADKLESVRATLTILVARLPDPYANDVRECITLIAEVQSDIEKEERK